MLRYNKCFIVFPRAFIANSCSLSAVLLTVRRFVFSMEKHRVCPAQVLCRYSLTHYCTCTLGGSVLRSCRNSSLFLILSLSCLFFFPFLCLKYVSLNPDLSSLSWDFEFAAQSLRMSIVFQGTAL